MGAKGRRHVQLDDNPFRAIASADSIAVTAVLQASDSCETESVGNYAPKKERDEREEGKEDFCQETNCEATTCDASGSKRYGTRSRSRPSAYATYSVLE